MLWKKSRSFYGSRLTPSQQHAFYGNAKIYLLKSNQSDIDLLFFMKQISEWTRFIKLKKSQNCSSLFLSQLQL